MKINLIRSGLLLLMLGTGCISPEQFSESDSRDVWLLALRTEQGRLIADAARNLTDRDGYDDQPSFAADGASLLYTSREEDRADIYRYVLDTSESVRLTTTLEREYSATPLPDGSGFSVIRVENDGRMRLWRFDPDGQQPVLLLEQPEYVHYYTWIDASTVALRVGDDPPSLAIVSLEDGSMTQVARSVGQDLKAVPGRAAVSFVHKLSDSEWWIKIHDLKTGQTEDVVQTLPGEESFAWTPTGELLMADGSSLYHCAPKLGGLWVEIADLDRAGIDGISRLAVSPSGDYLALVARH